MDSSAILNSSLLETGAKITKPIGLAGLFAIVLLLTLWKIISLKIFPTLTKALGGDLLKMIVVRLTWLSFAAMVLGFAGYALEFFLNLKETELRLQNNENGGLQASETGPAPATTFSFGTYSLPDLAKILEKRIGMKFRAEKPDYEFNFVHADFREFQNGRFGFKGGPIRICINQKPCLDIEGTALSRFDSHPGNSREDLEQFIEKEMSEQIQKKYLVVADLLQAYFEESRK